MEHSFQRLLTIRQLRLISVLGLELNLSKCAEGLHITQPAASRALSQLESLLGAPLFERTTRRITPTSAGLSLIQHANRVLAEIDVAEEELQGIRTGISGEVRIGVLPTFSSLVVARAIRQARGILPGVLFITQTQPQEDLYKSVLDRRHDLMLGHAELAVDLNLIEVIALYEEFSSVVAAHDHRLSRRKHVTWTDLADEAWVLPPQNTPLRPKLERMLSVYRSASCLDKTEVQADSSMIALALVRECGMLWAIANQYAAQFEAAGLVTKITIPAELLRGPMCCFRLRNDPVKTASRILISCLQESAKIGFAS